MKIMFEPITGEEFNTYADTLVPRLMREPPGKWVPIGTIAKDVARFIHICQELAALRYFDDPDGTECMIEVQKDLFVRISPVYRGTDTNKFRP